MVPEHVVRLGPCRDHRVVVVHNLAQSGGVSKVLIPLRRSEGRPKEGNQSKVEGHVELRLLGRRTVVAHDVLLRHDLVGVNLADHHAVVTKLLQHLLHATQNQVHSVLVLCARMQELLIPSGDRMISRPSGIVRLVPQLLVFEQIDERVDAKAADAKTKPESHDFVHRFDHGRLAPVQIWLLLEKLVVVVLPCRGVQLPRRALHVEAKHAAPVARRQSSFVAAVRVTLSPDVPVSLRGIKPAARLDEPRVLVGRVVGHKVKEHAQSELTSDGDETSYVIDGAERRPNAGVVADVVAKVRHWRVVNRRDPDHVDAQVVAKVDELALNATEGTRPSAGGGAAVQEGAWINLVHDPMTPPPVARRCCCVHGEGESGGENEGDECEGSPHGWW